MRGSIQKATEKKGDVRMEEILLLSKEFINKDDFIKEINFDSLHFELAGDNDQLCLLDDYDNLHLIINLIIANEKGVIIDDGFDEEVYSTSKYPYKGYLYSIEFNNRFVLDKIVAQLNNSSRNLYIQFANSNKFKLVK